MHIFGSVEMACKIRIPCASNPPPDARRHPAAGRAQSPECDRLHTACLGAANGTPTCAGVRTAPYAKRSRFGRRAASLSVTAKPHYPDRSRSFSYAGASCSVRPCGQDPAYPRIWRLKATRRYPDSFCKVSYSAAPGRAGVLRRIIPLKPILNHTLDTAGSR